jgi:GNAT superfamily N-acetyltransferase
MFSFNEYTISDDKSKLDLDTVFDFLSRSYWANSRSRERVEKSINNSLCYGLYHGGKQIGFARVVTDDATMYWLADVFIDEEYRSQGIGKTFVETIIKSERLKDLMGVLGTRDAHSLYEKYDFIKDDGRFMRRMPDYIRMKEE